MCGKLKYKIKVYTLQAAIKKTIARAAAELKLHSAFGVQSLNKIFIHRNGSCVRLTLRFQGLHKPIIFLAYPQFLGFGDVYLINRVCAKSYRFTARLGVEKANYVCVLRFFCSKKYLS